MPTAETLIRRVHGLGPHRIDLGLALALGLAGVAAVAMRLPAAVPARVGA